VVSLGVEALGWSKNVSWAIFDAIPAALAPVLDDMNLAFGNYYFTSVQRNTPIFHFLFSPRV
jgi:hypothetical protein